ncbi:prephenate dehydrogenase [Oceanobacillus chungangensis]|uniref:Prephenate dehydrogenase n=1 Tax=Oceanobacillus chungangensis TaxID=1229152 RepID=A0A3D8Q0S6_9BACI|nr:prephenate dehydrogenase [Oceanobacillus chungangensis]RDW22050.1 prephenate dehydrogenase [Oceanobacillus chungangensis]
MKRTVVIAGLGLIGGSLAKSMMKSEENYIIGYDVNQDSLEFARLNGIVHESTTSFKEALQNADIVILAAPISESIQLIGILNELPISKELIVSDVASVKTSIIKAASSLTNNKITFIGGHPMAGSHKRGISAAKAHLFENATYVLTPSVRSTEEKVETLKDVLKNTRSKFVVLSPDEHDEMTGVVSHFPHLIASSLVHQAKKWGDTHTYLPNLAAGGFRDITRIASSNPELWQDIFYHNREKMSVLLEEWIQEMIDLKVLVDNNKKNAMITYLQNAKNYRDGLPSKDKGVIPSFYDVYVDIKDQTGSIAAVAQLLAEHRISIKNIEILEMREGITGVLRLSFYSKKAQTESAILLRNNGFDTTIL